jgi:undecaprenyl-diphosphatase
VGAALAATGVATYAMLAGDTRLSPAIYGFDLQVSAAIQGWRTPMLTGFFRAVTSGANTLEVTLATVGVIAALMWLGRHREALLVAWVVAVGTGLGAIAKRVTARPRPPVANALIELPTSYSFPSGHALAALLLWTMIAFSVWRVTRRSGWRWSIVIVGVALMVLTGISRVYLGVHWPSDVVASWLLGGAWLALCFGGFYSWERKVGAAC